METQQSSYAENQLQVFREAVLNPAARARFLSDPEAYGRSKGVRFDPGFLKVVNAEVKRIDSAAANLENKFKVKVSHDKRGVKITGGRGTVMNAVVVAAAAAVVGAAAAVVSAVSATYMAFKWDRMHDRDSIKEMSRTAKQKQLKAKSKKKKTRRRG